MKKGVGVSFDATLLEDLNKQSVEIGVSFSKLVSEYIRLGMRSDISLKKAIFFRQKYHEDARNLAKLQMLYEHLTPSKRKSVKKIKPENVNNVKNVNNVLYITDVHVKGCSDTKNLEYALSTPFDKIVLLGDLIQGIRHRSDVLETSPWLEQYEAMRDVIFSYIKPRHEIFIVGGNHDKLSIKGIREFDPISPCASGLLASELSKAGYNVKYSEDYLIDGNDIYTHGHLTKSWSAHKNKFKNSFAKRVYSGHRHSYLVEETFDITYIQVPSLATESSYDKFNQFGNHKPRFMVNNEVIECPY